MAPIKTAILGTGIALNHLHWPLLNALPDLFQVTTVLERTDRGIARKVCGSHIKVVSTLDEILADKELDMVMVATADKTHYEYIKRSLEAGKHVFSDKPLTYTAAESEDLRQIAKKCGKVLGVFQNRRYDGDFLTAKRVIESGKVGRQCAGGALIGELSTFELYYDFYRPPPTPEELAAAGGPTWKDDPSQNGGGIYATGTHIIDQAVALFGVPDKISCRTWSVKGNGVDDSFDAFFLYPARPGVHSPLTVRCTTNWLSAIEPQLKYVIKGTQGGFVKHYEDAQWFELDQGKVLDKDYGIEPEERWGTLTSVASDGSMQTNKVRTEPGDYKNIYRDLAAAINANDQSKLDVTLESVIQQLKVVEVSLQSAKEERWMVRGKDY